MANSAIKRNLPFDFLGITAQPILLDRENQNWRSHLALEARRHVRERMYELWQDRWSSSPSGRITYGWIDDVNFVRTRGWFNPGLRVSNILTGHGFLSKLHERGLEPDPACAFGEGNETWEHVLFRCSLYEGLRM